MKMFCIVFPSCIGYILPFVLGEVSEKAGTSDFTHWSSIGASLVSTGFAVWYAWYMTTNRLPAIEKTHVEQMAAASARHSEQVKDSEQRHTAHIELLMKNFREDLKAMWEIRREDDKRLANSLDRLEETLRSNTCKYPPGFAHADRP